MREPEPLGIATMSASAMSVNSAETGATVGSWFAALSPAPPAALRARLDELLAPYLAQPEGNVPDACLEAGEHLLRELLASGSTSRGTALDLLAVDSLVTYAFQAAASTPELLEARAARAMERIALLP